MALTRPAPSWHPQLPAAVRAGMDALHAGPVYFAPVRHHSPACALAVQALIRVVRPAAVLIEGPDDFDALIPLLLDGATRPPVAVLSHAPGVDPAAADRSAFFPLCDYSPEWVALRTGAEVNARLAFIDLPWTARAADRDDPAAVSLMAERHLAHSGYLKALAARSGCRDQHELWDHLFELRPAPALRDWRALFADVYCYCALARHDYEPAVLEAEGSLPRERHMAAHLRCHLAAADGPVVVVTGGFHTPALQAQLAQAAIAPPTATGAAGSSNWLIRYSFDGLDALNGYASGMPAPGWYQRVWASAGADPAGPALRDVAAGVLAQLVHGSRTLGLANPLSTADLAAAVLQACRLAALRGHAGPGREDLLDAVRSCFVKGALDDGNAGLDADLCRLLCGHGLGDVPPSAGAPPLLEDARRRAARMRVRLDDSEVRTARLDLYRNGQHRERSRFLHLAAWLDLGLARWRSGPDFLAGQRLDLLFEEWDVAWSPVVEARLVALAAEGTTLDAVALARLRRMQAALAEDGQARSASAAVDLLLRGALVGLHDSLPALLDIVAARLEEDGDPASLIACCHRLLTLWRAREPLELRDSAPLRVLLQSAWEAAMYLLPQLGDAAAGAEAAAIAALLSLRAFRIALAAVPDDGWPDQWWARQLERLALQPGAAPGVAAAAAVLLFLDAAWSEERLAALLAAQLGPGGDREVAARTMLGLMTAGPELLLTQPGLRQAVDAVVAAWDEATFLRYLPDLRHAFTHLKPAETATLAAALAGSGASLADDHAASEADLMCGAALQARLAAVLARDGLQPWLPPDPAAGAP